jgi:hypothetical protein
MLSSLNANRGDSYDRSGGAMNIRSFARTEHRGRLHENLRFLEAGCEMDIARTTPQTGCVS